MQKSNVRVWTSCLVLVGILLGAALDLSPVIVCNWTNLEVLSHLRVNTTIALGELDSRDLSCTWRVKGLVSFQVDDFGRAQRFLAHSTTGKSQDVVSKWALGTIFAREGHYDEAVVLWREAGAYAYFVNQGNSLFGRGASALAESWFKTAVDIDPSKPDAYVGLGRVYLRQGLWMDAARVYRTMLARGLDSSLVYYNLADALSRSGGSESEIENYARKAIELNREVSVWAYVLLGNSLRTQGYFDAAHEWYIQATQVFPTSPWGWYYLAQLNLAQGDTCAAVANATHALEKAPQEQLVYQLWNRLKGYSPDCW